MVNLNIESDFKDFYDNLSNKKSIVTYHRFLKDSKQRGTALKYLRSIGIRTIEIKQVNQFMISDSPIVVYTDPKGHNGKGKVLMDVSEALRSYENYMASKYLDYSSGVTLKFLQIGKRRFQIQFDKVGKSLDIGRITHINEITPEYNRLIGLPIFSIDYVSNGEYMVATDFNEVENLERIGLDKFISAEEVLNEIREALIIYSKI
jgi:hypothetical protein